MVVVGGYNSSNTLSLAAMCAPRVRTYHVEDATCLDAESGTIHRPYSPAGSAEPLTSTGALNVMRAALSALGVQRSPHRTSEPKSARPRATGRR